MTKDELEKEISVLLSCNNCPENKGGYICQKEYENKCLAQKIQYIKELQQEIAELKSGCGMCYRKDKEKLVEAKELLKRWLRLYNTNTVKGIIADTEQFIKE